MNSIPDLVVVTITLTFSKMLYEFNVVELRLYTFVLMCSGWDVRGRIQIPVL